MKNSADVPTGGGEPTLSFEGVRQVFAMPKQRGKDAPVAKSVVALDNVDLEVPTGQFVALVGASGCGKTTLLNMVAGLVSPTSGVVRVNQKAPKVANLDIGYMFARDALLPGAAHVATSRCRWRSVVGIASGGMRGRWRCSISSACRTSTPNTGCSCPRACDSASRWHARWRRIPRSC
nr:ATP-binding cassette domain-containing protein [Nocardioides alcanivorans]